MDKMIHQNAPGTKMMVSEASPRRSGHPHDEPLSKRPPLGFLKVIWLDMKWRMYSLIGYHPNMTKVPEFKWHVWDESVERRAQRSTFVVCGNH